MKYFKGRRRKISRSKCVATLPEATETAFVFGGNDEVGADILTKDQCRTDFQTHSIEQSAPGSLCADTERDRCKDRLICARRRKDIRLTRKEVACLQVLVETVLSEHLVLSRELQAANERMGIPTELLENTSDASPLARNVERLQSALERDAARLKAALQDRDERLKDAAADEAALKLELEKWRRESAEEAEKNQAALNHALAERDRALDVAAEKDLVISNLRSELANLESRRSNEILCMSRALTDREVFIKKIENQVQDKVAELTMLRTEFNKNVEMLEMERTARHSTENNLDIMTLELKKARDEHEETAIMMSKVLSDKEAETEDFRKKLEDSKETFEHDLKEVKRAADANIKQIKYNCQKAVAQKVVELHEKEITLKKTQTQVQDLRSELEKEKNNGSVLRGELAVARNEIANARKALSQLEAKLDEERHRHEEQMRDRVAEFDDQLKNFRSEATLIQAGLENRISELKKEASDEKSAMEKQLAIIEDKLGEARNMALRLPTLESNLKSAEEEILFLKEKANKRNSELAAKKKEALQFSEEVKRTTKEMEIMRLKNEEEVKKLSEELHHLKEEKDKKADHFRQALHEKDLEIRERQDRLNQVQAEQEALQKSLSAVQKNLELATKQHKTSMANAKSAYRENFIKLKKEISKQSDEIEALQDTVKTLHSKISEQHRQHSQEIDKMKVSSEKCKNLLEKRIREKEALLKESEEKRGSLKGELSKALESREVILKELELVRNELKRTVDILCEAKAETRLALDTMADTERAMTSIYTDSVEEKIVLSKTQFKVDQLEQKWLDAEKKVGERKSAYDRLKIRFVKYMKCREDELKAAGDSVEQNRAEAQRYLNELKSSRTELASTEERCQSLKNELDSALRKAEILSANEDALVTQSEQNKLLLTLAEKDVENLKRDLCRQNSEVIQLKNELVERESKLEILSAELDKERALSAKQSAESQDAFALIDTLKKRGLVWNSDVKLPDGVDGLLQNIHDLESELEAGYMQFQVAREEHCAMQNELSLKTSELIDRDMMLSRKDESVEQLQSELNGLHQETCDQQNKIAELEKYLGKIEDQASAAFQAQKGLQEKVEEGRYFLHDANSRIDRLTSQLDHERSRVAELQLELNRAAGTRDSFQKELDEKASSIQDLTESLRRVRSGLFSKEERTDEATLHERLAERDREVCRLLSLLEHAHLECDCNAHRESADGDGNKETLSDGLKELKSALAERDADVEKLRSVIVDLQGELSLNKSTSDEEIALYRYRVEELSNEISALRRQLEEQELGIRASDRAKLDLHLTVEQTRLGGQDVRRLSPRRRPGAPGGAPLKRTFSDASGEWEKDLPPSIEVPVPRTSYTDEQTS